MSRAEEKNRLIMPERVLVLVTRDMSETTSKIVFRHEASLLEEIHGEGSVEVVDDPLKHEIFIGTPEEIAARTAMEDIEMDEEPGFMASIKAEKHPKRPVSINHEMDRLRTVYGKHMTKDEFVVDVVYPNPRLLLMEVGEVVVEPKQGKRAA